MSVVNLWNYPVFKGSLNEVDYKNQNHFVINTISPNSYGLSTKSSIVKEALQKSDIFNFRRTVFWLGSIAKARD